MKVDTIVGALRAEAQTISWALRACTPTTNTRWPRSASCAGLQPELFYPDDSSHGDHIKTICADCPVRLPCLQTAMVEEHRAKYRYGVRGGFGPHERATFQRITNEMENTA